MLGRPRLRRKLRLVESPYRIPQTLVGGPRLDAALMASSGGTAATKAMGKGSTQHQHLVQTEVPTKLLEEWLAVWTKQLTAPVLLIVVPLWAYLTGGLKGLVQSIAMAVAGGLCVSILLLAALLSGWRRFAGFVRIGL